MGNRDGYDVFLSYAHSDGSAAAELNGWLTSQGLHPLRPQRSPGLRWVPALENVEMEPRNAGTDKLL